MHYGIYLLILIKQALVYVIEQLDNFLQDRRELVQERLGSGPSPPNLSAINNNNNNNNMSSNYTLDIDRESLPLIENAGRGSKYYIFSSIHNYQ